MKITSFISLLCCLVCLAIGYITFRNDFLFFRNAIIIPGTIVRYEQHMERDENSDEERILYAAVVSYTLDGTTNEVNSSFSAGSPRQGNLGETLKVGINPKDKDDVRVKPGQDKFLFVATFMGSALLFGVTAFFSWYISKIFAFSDTKGPSSYLSFVSSIPFFITRYGHTIKVISRCLAVLVPLIIGAIIAYVSYNHATFFKSAVMVPGTVVRHNSYRETDSNKTTTRYQEIVSYSFNGKTYKLINNSPSGAKTYQVGVNPNNPYEARIYSKGPFVITLFLFGLFSIFLSLILWFLPIKLTQIQNQLFFRPKESFFEEPQ